LVLQAGSKLDMKITGFMIAAVGEYPLLVQLVLLANDIVNFTCELIQCDTDYDTNCDTMPDSRDVIVSRLCCVIITQGSVQACRR